ncbi:hypothetical protein GFL80_14145 [Rhizobium leguminosarum bv. viciae]|uniref:Fido domain-containing protein n=1 Tax=Rhizobium leguminosarum bv. viciae TaxID=387 RepID=A0A7G6RMS4_RHILV|nr:hypothetical protein [Rhizobium leguminosarum bv. viciae]NKK85382.1 hypothetical protein [Rhizobium leguminosarum bv. viciae]QND43556.1 hypothetical protein HB770_27095 [Rhizobium leguminosarum bv. viciae]
MCAHPPSQLFSIPCRSEVAALAAQLILAVGKAHAFEQGNKRTAWAAARLFIQNNGYRLKIENMPQLAIAHVAMSAVSPNSQSILGCSCDFGHHENLATSLDGRRWITRQICEGNARSPAAGRREAASTASTAWEVLAFTPRMHGGNNPTRLRHATCGRRTCGRGCAVHRLKVKLPLRRRGLSAPVRIATSAFGS